ncbi:MAG TPA: RNA 2',3'-cyclic phosphodiesterase [Candidatus Kapabacteria bacterium]|nr:RNA 2',3'-cyclic phosphodiesterase [Candidatus Kapabacteria bacterium]
MSRLFFAVETPDILKKELVKLQDAFAEDFLKMIPAPNFKPEHLANSHCTIRFLGNVEESNVERISEEARKAIAHTLIPPFECTLAKCGVFPNSRRAQVMWIGLSPEAPFQNIQWAIDQSLIAANISFEQEHAFHPHLTLFRFRESYRLPPNFEFTDLSENTPSALVSEVELVESKTFAEGPLHTIRAKFALK